MLLLLYAIKWIDSTIRIMSQPKEGEGDWDQKCVEEMSELIVRVSFICFCSPCVGGCWTICAGICSLWSRGAIDQRCSSGRCCTHSSTSLSSPSRPHR